MSRHIGQGRVCVDKKWGKESDILPLRFARAFAIIPPFGDEKTRARRFSLIG